MENRKVNTKNEKKNTKEYATNHLNQDHNFSKRILSHKCVAPLPKPATTLSGRVGRTKNAPNIPNPDQELYYKNEPRRTGKRPTRKLGKRQEDEKTP